MNPVETQPTPPPTLHIGGRLLASNTLINLVGRVAPFLVAIATVPYVIRHLGPDRFGLLSLAWMVVGYFALFNLGIGPATTKFVAELLGKGDIEKLPELVWTAFASQVLLGVVAGILLVAVTPLLVNRLLKIPPDLHAQAHWIFLTLAAVLPVDFASGSLGGVLGATQRFDLVNAVAIPSSILTYLLTVVAILLGFGLPAIVLFLAMARVAGLAGLFVLCIRVHPTLRAGFRFDRQIIRSLLGFGGWVAVSSATGPILAYFDRFLMGALASIAAVGYYTPPYMISSKLSLLPSSLMATLFPAFSTSAGRGDVEWIRKAFIRSLKFLLLLVGPPALLLAFFAHPILVIWLGAKFASKGALVLQILVGAMFVNSLAFVPYNLLYALGRPDIPAKFHLVELPLCIALDFILIIRFGLPGAALAWLVVNSLDFVLLIVAACCISHISPRLLAGGDLRRSVCTLTAFAGGFAGLLGSSETLIADATFILFLSGAFMLACWHYVLDFDERCQIRAWLKIAR